MYLKITYLNGEKHDPDFFGSIFTTNSALERPMRGETLVAITGERYFVKEVIVETQEVKTPGIPKKASVWNYRLEKIDDNTPTIVQFD